MYRNKISALTLFVLLAGVGIDAELSAWQRAPLDKARCEADGKSTRRCIKENTEDNEYSFGTLLTTQSFKVFNDFSAREKRQALDYADNNAMDPNDAVAKVSKRPPKSE